MAELRDLVGKRFGKLIVVERAPNKEGRVYWLCRCDCGNTKVVRANDLASGGSRACGCQHSKGKIINHVGNRFGRLVVINCAGKNGKATLWSCQCDCGGKVVVAGTSLANGHTKSCGCLFTEYKASQVGAKHWNWKGGTTPLRHVIHKLYAYREWHDAVFHRDNFTCQRCLNPKIRPINAHHIKPFYQILAEHNITTLAQATTCEELWDIWNGTTLCTSCHVIVHQEAKTCGRPRADKGE